MVDAGYSDALLDRFNYVVEMRCEGCNVWWTNILHGLSSYVTSSYVMLYKPEIICAVGLSSYVIENELFVSMGCMCYNNGLYVVCAIIIGWKYIENGQKTDWKWAENRLKMFIVDVVLLLNGPGCHVIIHVIVHVSIHDDMAMHPWRLFSVIGNGLGLG